MDRSRFSFNELLSRCARNLTNFSHCVFNEVVFIYALSKVSCAPERVLKKSSVEQILLSYKAMPKGMDC